MQLYEVFLQAENLTTTPLDTGMYKPLIATGGKPFKERGLVVVVRGIFNGMDFTSVGGD